MVLLVLHSRRDCTSTLQEDGHLEPGAKHCRRVRGIHVHPRKETCPLGSTGKRLTLMDEMGEEWLDGGFA